MEKIDYKHGRFNIATTDIDLDDFPYEEYAQECRENGMRPQSSDSDDYYDWMHRITDENYESDMENIADCKAYKVPVCVNGTLGLWYGKVDTCTFVYDCVADAIANCIGNDAQDVDIFYDNGHIEVQVHHHDGTNIFDIYALSKKGISKAKGEKTMDDPKPWDIKRLPYLYAI